MLPDPECCPPTKKKLTAKKKKKKYQAKDFKQMQHFKQEQTNQKKFLPILKYLVTNF